MNSYEKLIERRSTKKFKSDMLPDDLIQKIIDAGLHAPSAMNLQSPIIVCIKDKDLRDRLEKLNYEIAGRYDGHPFYNAPVVLLVLVKKDAKNGIYDGSLCIGNMLNAAYMLGIGSCWIHRAKEEFELEEGKEILSELGLDEDYIGIGHCIIGYPDNYSPNPKKIKENRVIIK